MRLTGLQISAAIALADMTRAELASAAGIGRTTLDKIIKEEVAYREDTIEKIHNVLEKRDIEFLPGQGVRKKDRFIETYEGEEANKKLLDDVYKTLRDIGGEVLIAGLDEKRVIGDLEESFLMAHIDRLHKANITERLLICEGDTYLVAPEESYRWIDSQFFSPYPLYIYGPKLALVSWAPARRCTIIHDEAFAESTRRLFNFVWQNAKKLNGASIKDKDRK